MSLPPEKIAENYHRVCERVGRAASAAGRDSSEITIVGVTKYVGRAETEALIAAGCRDLGESRPQSLWEKSAAILGDDLHWHMIGHLQRNKVRRSLSAMSLLHSLDSLRLARQLDAEAAQLDMTVAALVEVNVSGDTAKDGLPPQAVEEFLSQVAALEHLQIRGLMCMAALEGDERTARKNFAQLRTLRDRLATHAPSQIELAELSMGMSGDFEAAILEGATIVRIGSVLFQ